MLVKIDNKEELNFDKQINYLVGINGSGKSRTLLLIDLLLGEKTKKALILDDYLYYSNISIKLDSGKTLEADKKSGKITGLEEEVNVLYLPSPTNFNVYMKLAETLEFVKIETRKLRDVLMTELKKDYDDSDTSLSLDLPDFVEQRGIIGFPPDPKPKQKLAKILESNKELKEKIEKLKLFFDSAQQIDNKTVMLNYDSGIRFFISETRVFLDPSDLSWGEAWFIVLISSIILGDADHRNPDLILLDSPDIGLHIIKQDWIANNLEKLTKAKVIIATHSPGMLGNEIDEESIKYLD